MVQSSFDSPKENNQFKDTSIRRSTNIAKSKGQVEKENVPESQKSPVTATSTTTKDGRVKIEKPFKNEKVAVNQDATRKGNSKAIASGSPLLTKLEEKPRFQKDKPIVFYRGKDEPAPFLLSIRIFGKMLHNCLMDSGASSNVMPLVVC